MMIFCGDLDETVFEYDNNLSGACYKYFIVESLHDTMTFYVSFRA